MIDPESRPWLCRGRLLDSGAAIRSSPDRKKADFRLK
jgi:hypothetical protein